MLPDRSLNTRLPASKFLKRDRQNRCQPLESAATNSTPPAEYPKNFPESENAKRSIGLPKSKTAVFPLLSIPRLAIVRKPAYHRDCRYQRRSHSAGAIAATEKS